MKKMMSVCLCLMLVVAMAVTVFATNGAAFSATASAETLYRGDTVTLSVKVDCSEEATSYGLMLNYDATVFELVEGKCAAEGALVNSFDNGFAFMFQNPTVYSGSVGTVTLKVKADAAFGTATVAGEASVKNGTTAVTATGFSASFTVACQHSYGEWTEAENGHVKTCPTCGDVKTADHVWDNGTVAKEATCTEEGTTKYTCADCAAIKEEAISMIPHAYGEWENVDENTHKHVCGACQKEETENHGFAEELTAGEQTHWYACACGAKKEESAHTFDETTWSKDELTHWHGCTCGAKADEVAHSWDEGVVTTEATQNQEGEKTYTCADCGETKIEKIPQLAPTPQTGDEAHVLPFVLLMLVSAFGLFATVVAKKKFCR